MDPDVTIRSPDTLRAPGPVHQIAFAHRASDLDNSGPLPGAQSAPGVCWRGMHRREFLTAVAALGVGSPRLARPTPAWRAGVATIDITPENSLWMAGFAARTQASQGTALPLHAKALALECGNAPTAVLVTVDLLGVTARITDRVAAIVQRRHGIRRADLLFNASHTHCGPIVDEQLSVAYDLSRAQWDDIRTYTERLEGQLWA